MAEYEYKNGLLGSRVSGYKNENEYYNIEERKDGFTVFSKKGETLFEVDDEKSCKITVHTFGELMSIAKYHKKADKTRVITFNENSIVSEANITGEVVRVIAGSEGMFFQKYHSFSGNRVYYKVVNENDKTVTPPYQVIIHETNEDDGLDRFYCENYAELSREEFLEEDDEEYANNLVESAVYTSDGKELFSQIHSKYSDYSNYSAPMTDEEKINSDFNKQMIAGAAVSAVNPVIGSAIMVSASVHKNKKLEELNNKSSESENQPGM